MALETLKGIKFIGNEKVLQERVKNKDGSINWEKTDEARKESPIFIDHDVDMISFKIQNGAIKEVGKNGCQVDEILETCKLIIEGLNKKIPCRENSLAITKIEEAQLWLIKRKLNREKTGTEGFSK